MEIYPLYFRCRNQHIRFLLPMIFCSKLEKTLSEIYEGNSDFATSPVQFPFEKR